MSSSQNIIPDGVYQEFGGLMYFIVDNSKREVSTSIMEGIYTIYKYSIENGIITMNCLKDGITLRNHITIYSNPTRFELQPDNAQFTYISPLK